MESSKHQARQAGQMVVFLLVMAAAKVPAQVPATKRIRREVLVSVADRKLAVLDDGNVVRIFPIAVGARVSPSPKGEFQIANRVVNPAYYHPGIVIQPGKNNPLGTRWIGLTRKGYGIHGTNEPGSIGKAASHGCIRLRNRDIQELFAMVTVGDTVEIRGEPDQQTAAIFAADTDISDHEIDVVEAGAAGGAK